ncbi:MAG: hypothetical protein ACP5UU_05770, partial [Thermoprotei archaeon]
MNYALKSKEVRVVHAALFPQGEEVKEFVEDGDRSHLRALARPGDRWRSANLTLLGSAAADAISSLGYSRELNRALSMSPEECSSALSSLLQKLRELADKGKSYGEAKRQLDSAMKENQGLRDEQKEVEDKFAELNKELADKRGQIRQLTKQVNTLKKQLEDLKQTERNEQLTISSLKWDNEDVRKQLKSRTEELKAKSDELEAKKQGLTKLTGERNDLLKRYSAIEAEMNRQKEEGDAKISACEKAREEAQLLAEKRGWAVGPLSLALSLTAKEVDPLKLSWDAEKAIRDSTKAAWEENFLGLPENMVSLELPKGLDPKYALAFWTGLFDYASAKFVADGAAMVSKKLLATLGEAITKDEIKDLTMIVDAEVVMVNEFLSKTAVELFGSYWSVKDMLRFLSSDKVTHDAFSFSGCAYSVKGQITKRVEDLKMLVEYAATGKRVAKALVIERARRKRTKSRARSGPRTHQTTRTQ